MRSTGADFSRMVCIVVHNHHISVVKKDFKTPAGTAKIQQRPLHGLQIDTEFERCGSGPEGIDDVLLARNAQLDPSQSFAVAHQRISGFGNRDVYIRCKDVR